MSQSVLPLNHPVFARDQLIYLYFLENTSHPFQLNIIFPGISPHTHETSKSTPDCLKQKSALEKEELTVGPGGPRGPGDP